MPRIKLTVQGVELTKVKRHRKIQSGVSRGNSELQIQSEPKKPKKTRIKPAPVIE
jgi:hypothetical protein